MTDDGGDQAFHAAFAGVASFLNAPIARDPTEPDIAIGGIPFDLGVTNRAGARHGPRQVRDLSTLMRPYHPTLELEPLKARHIADIGDADTNPFSIAASLDKIEARYAALRAAGVVPLSVGGDHLTTLPVLRALARGRERPLGVIQIDAHCDTAGPYLGQPHHHGCTFRSAAEEGLIDPARTVQIGIRGPLEEPGEWHYSYDSGMTVIPIEAYFDRGWRAVIEHAKRVVGDDPVYVSFDIDGLDPVHAPGTGTPEAGGIPIHEAQRMLRALTSLSIAGADVVEVSPPFDPRGDTALSAATVLFELASVMAAGSATAG